MKKGKSILLMTVAAGLYGVSATAETQSDTYGAQPGAQTDTRPHAEMGQKHKAMKQAVQSASKLMGKSVQDQQGEELGEIEDFALDLQQGQLNYVVLSTGGTMGQRLVGIAANELRLAPEDEGFIANVTQQEIEQAQELPDENLPAQPAIGQSATEFAPMEGQSVQGTTSAETRTQTQTGTGQVGSQVESQSSSNDLSGIQKASTLIGTTVRDQQGQDLGKIEDFAIDMNQGKLNYVVIDAGGFLTQRLIGIAANELNPTPDGDAFVANVTQQQIESATALPDQNWPEQPSLGSTAAGQTGGEFAPFEGDQEPRTETEWEQEQQDTELEQQQPGRF